MNKKGFEEKKRIAFLLIHYILMLLFLSLASISLWYGNYESTLLNSFLGIAVYIESVQYLPVKTCEKKSEDL